MAAYSWTPAGEDEAFDDFDGFVLGNDIPDLQHGDTKGGSGVFESTPTSNNSTAIQTAPAETRNRGGFGSPPKKTTRRSKLNGLQVRDKKCVQSPNKQRLPRSAVPSVDDFRVASMKNNVSVIKEYLQQGLEVDVVLKCGWTALMYAASFANSATVELLLQKGANASFHQDQYTVLMSACACQKADKDGILRCVKLLVEAGADVNSHDRYHMSPLIYSAREGHVQVIEYLGECGVQMNKQDNRGWTALSWAVNKNQKGAVQKLLELKADAYKKHSDGQTAADLAYAENLQDILVMMRDPRAHPETARVPTGIITPVDHAGHLAGEIFTSGASFSVYGELELFLSGLGLADLIPLFQHHRIDFAAFLCLSDHDLEKMGIEQVGVRKKILNGIMVVHTKNWETSSLKVVQSHSKQISYAESVAVLANISSHMKYIGSTVSYIQSQVRAHPNILDSQDGTGPKSLCQYTVESVANLQGLETELTKLHRHLQLVMKKGNFQPPDLIKPSRNKKRNVWRRRLFHVCLVGMTASAILIWREKLITMATTIWTTLKPS